MDDKNDKFINSYCFILSYCIVSYCFTWPLRYRLNQGSINPYLFLVQNDMDHLATSAGVCPTGLVSQVEKPRFRGTSWK